MLCSHHKRLQFCKKGVTGMIWYFMGKGRRASGCEERAV
ncbi:MAG: hypothetical protein AW12_03114 [Candidatus Accumulibacter sp. BA-94]|nr:MAG: hypothetical protein AW12_03114 [Candidatus Accumulibacter sp. BA-94]